MKGGEGTNIANQVLHFAEVETFIDKDEIEKVLEMVFFLFTLFSN